MATIKSYTSVEQSRKLAEILPLESADMMWEQHGVEPYVTIKPWTTIGKSIGCHCLSCWSLAALLSVLPKTFVYNDHTYQFMYNTNAMFYINLDTYDEDTFCSTNENLVDACYEMIIKLNELKIL